MPNALIISNDASTRERWTRLCASKRIAVVAGEQIVGPDGGCDKTFFGDGPFNVAFFDATTARGSSASALSAIAKSYPAARIVLVCRCPDDLDPRLAAACVAVVERTRFEETFGETLRLVERSATAQAARRPELESPRRRRRLIGERPRIRDLERNLDFVASSAKPVLILGERGSGRSLIAERIASTGVRANAPYLVVDCSQPAATLERELFGDGESPGKIAYVDDCGGTLAFDSFDRVPASLEDAALSVAFGQTCGRRGAAGRSDVKRARFIFIGEAGSDASESPARRGLFNAAGLTIYAPSYRELTTKDLRDILDAALSEARNVVGRDVVFSEPAKKAAVDAAKSVAELTGIVDAAVAFNETGELEVADLVAAIKRARSTRGPGSGLVGRTFEQIRRAALVETLNACGGSQTQTARSLDVSVKTVQNWIKEYKLR
ncbi:MAG: sigma 54-interacting transcriptional regulator [Thermoguttaceae bacterium]|nr:sigma 54-interacting transcriptional regulator [Thermoguttaceae bacterium]